MQITVSLLNNIGDRLEQIPKKADKAMRRAFAETKRKGIVIIRKKATARYTIKPGLVKPSKVDGGMVHNIKFHYKGKPQSLNNFNARPTPKNSLGGRSYKIRATIVRGSRSVIGHWSKPWSEGGAYKRPGITSFFIANGYPTQRQGYNSLKPFRTISMPGIVGAPEVGEPASIEIAKAAGAAIHKHLKNYL